MARFTTHRLLSLVAFGVALVMTPCSGPAPGNPALSAHSVDVESLWHPVASEVVSCPFTSEVSGDVIKAVSDFGPTQIKSSNTHCVWESGRMPDSLSIRLDAIDEVSATDHSDRLFHVGRDVIVEPQSGPGTDAVLLRDPAFDEPFAYRYVFTLGDVVVDIEMGLHGLTAQDFRMVADDVAANLVAAPQISPWEAGDRVYAANYCSIWETSGLEATFDVVIEEEPQELIAGCEWRLGFGARIALAIWPDPDYLTIESAAEDVEPLDLGEHSTIQRFGGEERGYCHHTVRAAVSDGYVASIEVSTTFDGPNCDPIIELAENLIARTSWAADVALYDPTSLLVDAPH